MSATRCPESKDIEYVWNFAYGANINPKSMRRRGCTPLESIPAVLQDYKLMFDHKGFPFIEPAFANIQAQPNHCVHGILHKLTPSDWKRLVFTEGGGGDPRAQGYDTKLVHVTTYDGKEMDGYAFQTVPAGRHITQAEWNHPSKRYVRLIVEGARQSGIKEDYIQQVLETQPTYHSTLGAKIFAGCAIVVLFPLVLLPFLILWKLGISSSLFHFVMLHIKNGLWWMAALFAGHEHAAQTTVTTDTTDTTEEVRRRMVMEKK